MADIRRQPEWQQQVDRHSVLTDPVLTVRPISRFDYTARRPVAAIDHALVFATQSGRYDVYIPPHRPSRTDAATRRYISVYEVDTGSHPVRLELQLPSEDDAFAFAVSADLSWRVVDPEAYVRGGERDVPTRLTRELQQFTRPVSRRYPIESSAAAEAAVQQTVEASPLAAGIGLAITCVVQLRLDDEAIAQRRRMRALRYQNEMLDPEYEFQLRQSQQQHALDVLRQRQEQELASAKIDFYQYHLHHGGIGAWALHLSSHPEDTQLVINNIRQDQLIYIKNQLELIGSNELEDYQKAESLKRVRQEVDDLIHRRATAPGGQRELPAGVSADPSAYRVEDAHGGYAPVPESHPVSPGPQQGHADSPHDTGPSTVAPPPPPAYPPLPPQTPSQTAQPPVPPQARDTEDAEPA